MTERGLPIVDGAPACPFVAFEDDRDERATSPDHRHRCFAEPDPAPRALAHQEAYCLSSAFPVCPTFQDWARREAARSRGEGPRPSESTAAAIAAGQAQRNPPRNWAAPPPWSGRGGPPDSSAPGLWSDPDEEPDDRFEDADAPPRPHPSSVRGLSGSYADRVAADTGGGVPPPGVPDEPVIDDEIEEPVREPAPPPRRREREPSRIAAAGPERHPADRHRDPVAPEWERARAQEAYPTLRARSLPSLSVPPLLVAVIALALAAAVLFALPGLLGFGNPSAVATPSPSAGPTSLASLPPTPVPEPTQQLYTVQPGDTMSRIAGRFGIPLGDLIAANAENIPDPDKLQIGDQVIIPIPIPSDVPGITPIPPAT
jgi:hypothetical protein